MEGHKRTQLNHNETWIFVWGRNTFLLLETLEAQVIRLSDIDINTLKYKGLDDVLIILLVYRFINNDNYLYFVYNITMCRDNPLCGKVN